MAAADFHHGGIKSGYFMALGLRHFDECLRHGEAVAVLSRTSCDHNNFFAHNSYLLKYGGVSVPRRIDVSACRYYNHNKNATDSKYAHKSAILTSKSNTYLKESAI